MSKWRGPALFALVGLDGWGWDAFGDPARSGFVLAAVLCAAALWMLADRRDPVLWLVCMTGAALQGLTAACGVAYGALSSREIGVCDEGTGRPVRAAVGVLVILVAAYVLRVSGDGSRRR